MLGCMPSEAGVRDFVLQSLQHFLAPILNDAVNFGRDEPLASGTERKARHIPTSLPVEKMQVLPTFEAAFGREPDSELAEIARELSEEPLQQQVYVADDIDEKIRQASRATSLAATPAPGT